AVAIVLAKNAEISRVFRRFLGTRYVRTDDTQKRPASRSFAIAHRTRKIIGNQPLCGRHPFMRVSFYINLPSALNVLLVAPALRRIFWYPREVLRFGLPDVRKWHGA